MSENLPAQINGETGAIVERAMISPAATIDEAVEEFKRYQELRDKLGTEDDFQQIRKKKHPKKSFVRKVQRYFNVSCELLRDEPLYVNEILTGWLVTARAKHLPTGAYQDADGSCELIEKATGQATIHNVRAHAVTRAKNRAILDLVGFGEVSADEIIDQVTENRVSRRQQAKDTPKPEKRDPGASSRQETDDPTDKDRRDSIWRKAQQVDWTSFENWKDGLAHVLGSVAGTEPVYGLTDTELAKSVGKLTPDQLKEVDGRLSEMLDELPL